MEAAIKWGRVLPWKSRTIIDVGAHDGSVAQQFDILYKPNFIACVEPNPEKLVLLKAKNFSAAVKIFPYALGGKEGKITLNLFSDADSNSIFEINPEATKNYRYAVNKIKSIEVPLRKLDDVFEECSLDYLDFLKINTEGSELEILQGAKKRLNKISFIVTETMFFERYKGQPLFKDIENLLQKAGFMLIGTFRYIYNPAGLPLQCMAAFVNQAMAEERTLGCKVK